MTEHSGATKTCIFLREILCISLIYGHIHIFSVRPHRRQPTRLPGPWDSPSKNTGVGCHFLLQCMKVKSENEVIQSCPTLATPWTAAHQAPPSMGFSRQKYWSGVPLPSPIMWLRSFVFVFTFGPKDLRGCLTIS